MRTRFDLQGPPFGILVVVVGKCSINVSRVRVVTLDQIRVVAVHGSDQVADRRLHLSRKLPGQAIGSGYEVERSVVEVGPAFTRKHGLDFGSKRHLRHKSAL
jgi:hypothetical protein